MPGWRGRGPPEGRARADERRRRRRHAAQAGHLARPRRHRRPPARRRRRSQEGALQRRQVCLGQEGDRSLAEAQALMRGRAPRLREESRNGILTSRCIACPRRSSPTGSSSRVPRCSCYGSASRSGRSRSRRRLRVPVSRCSGHRSSGARVGRTFGNWPRSLRSSRASSGRCFELRRERSRGYISGRTAGCGKRGSDLLATACVTTWRKIGGKDAEHGI